MKHPAKDQLSPLAIMGRILKNIWTIRRRSLSLQRSNPEAQKPEAQKFVTLGFDMQATILTDDGKIFPRKAELIFHKEYYKAWPAEKWPRDPLTGELLPIRL